MKRVGQLKKVYLLPNLVTTACLFSGFFSIIRSLNGDYVVAAWAIMVAGLFDSLDGRLARLTKSESEFGVEYDSLSDLISFGVAPGILIYSWNLHSFSRLGVMVTFLFFACAALRLARYNVQINRVEKSSFQGLPIPMAAGPLITWVIFYDHFYGGVPIEPSYFTLGLTFVLAVLMVSTVRYRSFKQIQFKSRRSFYYLVGGVGFIFVVALEPKVTFFVASLAYMASALIEEVIFFRERRLERKTIRKDEESKTKRSTQVRLFKIQNKTSDTKEKK